MLSEDVLLYAISCILNCFFRLCVGCFLLFYFTHICLSFKSSTLLMLDLKKNVKFWDYLQVTHLKREKRYCKPTCKCPIRVQTCSASKGLLKIQISHYRRNRTVKKSFTQHSNSPFNTVKLRALVKLNIVHAIWHGDQIILIKSKSWVKLYPMISRQSPPRYRLQLY